MWTQLWCSRRLLWLLIGAGWLAGSLLISPRQACAAPPPAKRLPTAALIDRDGGVVGGLLQAKLLDDERAVWLERNEIQRLLAEQQLDAAFGAAGGPQRLSLGKLLKADLLMLVRTVDSPVEKEKKLLECVVCETRQGLRLRIAFAPAEQDAAETVAAFLAAFDAGLRKSQETVQAIVAVSPLVSDNLGFDKNYLQTAYAKLIEQALLDQPGVVVVELGEAQAISGELGLVAENKLARNRQPLFLLGKFRHTGRGEDTTVSVEVRLLRGDKPLGQRAHKSLPVAEVGEWLNANSLELLRKFQSVKVARSLPAAEAKQLAARAEEFFRIGNWEEALALMEASLLLRPEQEELRHLAVVACGKQVFPHVMFGQLEPERIAAAVSLYQRGLEHLEAFLRIAGGLEKHWQQGALNFISMFEHSTNGWGLQPSLPDETKALVADMLIARRETYLRMARFRAKAGFPEEGFAHYALRGMPEKDQYAAAVRVIEEFGDLPDGRYRAFALALTIGNRYTPDYQKFLEELSGSELPQVRDAVTDVRDMIARMEARDREVRGNAEPDDLAVVKEITLEPIALTLRGQPFNSSNVLGCVPANEGCDIFAGAGSLYVMRQRGELEQIWTTPELNVLPTSLVFDGRYVWAAFQRHRRSPLLLVVDLNEEKAVPFTLADGLPGDETEHVLDAAQEIIRLAPVGPGRVCAAGSLGRSWLGWASYDGTKKSLRIFHEARDAGNNEDASQAQSTTVAFNPVYALTVENRDADEPAQTVFVGRGTGNIAANDTPLMIDVASETVALAPFPLIPQSGFWLRPEPYLAVMHGQLFLSRLSPQSQVFELSRVAAPDLNVELLSSDLPEGHYAAHGTELHILGKKWWIYDTVENTLRVACSPVPWRYDNRWARKGKVVLSGPPREDDLDFVSVHPSHHYQLVAGMVSKKGQVTLLHPVRASGDDE